jgi:GGDEF domain-containing protein
VQSGEGVAVWSNRQAGMADSETCLRQMPVGSQVNPIRRLISAVDALAKATALRQKSEPQQARLLAWRLMISLLFSSAVLFVLWLFTSHHDPEIHQYTIFISVLVLLFITASISNYGDYYHTISVAAVPAAGATGESILKSADTALYQAKQQGRKHMIVAG